MTDQSQQPLGALSQISEQLADAAERAAVSVVRVNARQRLGASGVVWTAGVVVTADHVVEQDENISISARDGQTHEATLVGRDPRTDLAVLRAPGLGAPAIAHGGTPRAGNLALLVARPIGSDHASLAPIRVVGFDRSRRRDDRPLPVLGVDVTFRPGFSGGALVDVDGRLLGIASSGFGRGGGGGLVVALAAVEQTVNSLLQHGRVRRGYLGITSQSVEIPPAMRAALGNQQTRGLLILDVAAGSPAEQGGLLMGDLLIRIGQDAVRGTEDLQLQLVADRVGQAVQVTVLRGGQAQTLQVTVGEQA